MPTNDFTRDGILSRFRSVVLTNVSRNKASAIEHNIEATALAIVDNTSPSREQSLALTKLEEAKMWALRSIVVDQANRGEPTEALIDTPVEDETR